MGALTGGTFRELLAWLTFSVLLGCYAYQYRTARRQARKPIEKSKGAVSTASLTAVIEHGYGWVYSGWTFVVLALGLPILLNTLGNVHGIMLGSAFLPEWSAFVYYFSVAAIGVTITLEFSYVYTLWKTGSDWIHVLLVAIVLDIGTLLVLFLVVAHPNSWDALAATYSQSGLEDRIGIPPRPGPGFLTTFIMFLTTCAALVSSATILVYARADSTVRNKEVDLAEIEEKLNPPPGNQDGDG